MCKENCTEINLSSSVFNEMRDNFDAILKKALGNIVKGKSGQADINLKLTISATGENEGQLKPKFKHQVSSVMAIKERESGMVNPNAEMVYDEEEGEYVLRPVKSAQTTLFDTEEKDNEQHGSPESAPSAPVAMLGDGSEESKQGHENDAYNVKFGPFDADDYDIQARKAIVDLLQGYGAKYEITDGGRFVECTISAMHIEDIKEQAEPKKRPSRRARMTTRWMPNSTRSRKIPKIVPPITTPARKQRTATKPRRSKHAQESTKVQGVQPPAGGEQEPCQGPPDASVRYHG